ncbi:hypothetical protein GF373_10520 [bacterium]|nr:hypothetical protein [bacterium]
MCLRIFYFCIAIVFLIAGIHPVQANKIKPMSLDTLCLKAGLIFEGKCIDIKTGKDPQTGFLSTWYTFKILDGIKGGLKETITIKQYGGTEEGITLKAQMTTYKEDETVVLFLYPSSRKGYTSSVGMSQGKFVVKTLPEEQGQYVTNGMPAVMLFDGMPRTLSTLTARGVPAEGQARLRSSRMRKKDFTDYVKSIIKEQSHLEKK